MPLKWIRKNIIADGNCFFRALYNSAIESGNIKKLIKSFKLSKNISEEEFIDEFREVLIERINNSKDYNITRDIYNYLKSLDKDTYQAVLEAFPSWCQKSLRKLPSTFEGFRDKFVRHIAKRNTWISELEARLTLKLLSKYKIPIQIHNSLPGKKEQLDCKTMHLLNEHEVHYNILVCRDCPPDKIVNPKSKRCVSKTGNIGKNLRNF